jgi:hypothetical protein
VNWIMDRTPTQSAIYLVSTKQGDAQQGLEIAYFDCYEGGWKFGWPSPAKTSKGKTVVAWMELPDPPQMIAGPPNGR